MNAQPECTGICRIVASLAKYARSFGYEISVLFLGDGPLVAELRNSGVHADVVSWSAKRNDLGGAWQTWRWLRSHPASIAHLHHGGLTVRAVCRLSGVRGIVQHVHGRILEPSGTSISQMDFRAVDAIVACSQAVADCLPNHSPEVIYSGVECRSQPVPANTQAGALRLGVLARLIPLKNIEALIDANFRLLEMGIEVRTEIAGSGPSETSLRDKVVRLGLEDRVHFLGWQSNINELLEKWDVLVIPSWEEGLPVSALEAMAMARPVVASQVSGLRELIIDGVTGRLFPPGDTDALTACIAELATDRSQLSRMGYEGWRRIHSCYSAELMAYRTAELYDRILH